MKAAKTKALQRIQVRDDDLFIVSYPRSGNTWIRFLLANLMAPDETITFRNIEDYVPDLHKSSRDLANRKGRRFIKSHHPLYSLYPRFVYVYRDGRDAVVSYFHYLRDKKVFTGTFEEFVFSDRASKFGSWSDHANAALDFAVAHPDRVLLLQYERMLEEAQDAARRAAAFAGLEFDESSLAAAVAKSSFGELQSIEKKFGGEKREGGGTFFRAGQTGKWRTYFSDALYQKYLAKNSETLTRLGYSP